MPQHQQESQAFFDPDGKKVEYLTDIQLLEFRRIFTKSKNEGHHTLTPEELETYDKMFSDRYVFHHAKIIGTTPTWNPPYISPKPLVYEHVPGDGVSVYEFPTGMSIRSCSCGSREESCQECFDWHGSNDWTSAFDIFDGEFVRYAVKKELTNK